MVRGTARDPAAFLLRRALWLARTAVRTWRLVAQPPVRPRPRRAPGRRARGQRRQPDPRRHRQDAVRRVRRPLLREHELRVAILSRGYGAEAGRNDEAMVLEENLPDVPHYQGADRVALAQTAVEELESEVLVLDDGFQHRRLARDLDIVLIDATDPWGSGYLFPRGVLREPRQGLRRAGMVVLTRCDQVEPTALDRLTDEVRQLAAALVISRDDPRAAWNSRPGRLGPTSNRSAADRSARSAASATRRPFAGR